MHNVTEKFDFVITVLENGLADLLTVENKKPETVFLLASDFSFIILKSLSNDNLEAPQKEVFP